MGVDEVVHRSLLKLAGLGLKLKEWNFARGGKESGLHKGGAEVDHLFGDLAKERMLTLGVVNALC